MIITSSEVKQRLSEAELLIKYAAEIAELKSQVEDLQEQVRNTNTQSNLKDWEIKRLTEKIRLLQDGPSKGLNRE